MIEDIVHGESVLWELIKVGSDIPSVSKLLPLGEGGNIIYDNAVTSDEVMDMEDGEYQQYVTIKDAEGNTSFKILPDNCTIGTVVNYD